MNDQKNNKRKVLIYAGASDVILGGALLLIGFGFFPIDISNYGVPFWVVILIGGLIFISGTWMVIYNYSRMDE